MVKTIIFAGAPGATTLNWDERGLLTMFNGSFGRLFHLDDADSQVMVDTTPTSEKHPAWRSIPLERQHLPTGVSQDHAWREEDHGATFFTPSQIGSYLDDGSFSPKQDYESCASVADPVEQVLSQFYEKSYALHEDVPSSQIAALSQSGTSFTTTESFETTEESVDLPPRQDVPVIAVLHNIKDIPNATYINSIQPQTMTVNLIVGIISLPSPRSITTRRGAKVQLIEALVGDETKSGFTINFWLPASPTDSELCSAIQGLRCQDVILLKNVALSTFRGKVYGQSLRKGMTKVILLYRNKIDRTDVAGCYSARDLECGDTPQAEKTKTVREWVLRFVGVGAQRGKRKVLHESLPPDTQ